MGALYGSAAFDGLSIDQAGMGYTLEATDLSPGSLLTGVNIPSPASTTPFNVTPGPATQLEFPASGEPPRRRSRARISRLPRPVVVDAEDQFGSVATSPTNGPVTIALANNATGGFTGTLTVNAINGVATFTNLEIDTDGTYNASGDERHA